MSTSTEGIRRDTVDTSDGRQHLLGRVVRRTRVFQTFARIVIHQITRPIPGIRTTLDLSIRRTCGSQDCCCLERVVMQAVAADSTVIVSAAQPIMMWMSTVAVTGSASGLGRVIASRVAAEGHDLVLVDRDPARLAQAAQDLRREHGVAVEMLVGDLSSVTDVESIAAELQGIPHLTALVNNAGGWCPGAQYPTAAESDWMAAMMLNLLAPMLLTQRLWSAFALRSGAVVNIGSSGGIGDGSYGSPEYGAAKAGMRRFTASLGERADVRVMAVVPGWIGLERARAEFALLSVSEQQRRGPLIAPPVVADTVVRLLQRGRAGEVVELLG